jgi:alkylhydroperoxidase family enzyme
MGRQAVDAVLADLASAPIGEPLRATLGLLRKVTRDHAAVTADDIRPLLAFGVTRSQIEVAFCFNVITRLADTFAFAIPSQASFEASAKMLLSRGYR